MTTTADLYNAIADKGVLFNVRREPMFLANGTQVKGRDAIVRADTDQPIAIVSKTYRVINNEDMIRSSLQAIETAKMDLTDASVEVQTAYDGARSMVTLVLPAYRLSVQEKNDTAMQMVMLNSYDASWKFVARVGGFRFKCANGQFFGQKIGGYSMFHRQNLDVTHLADNMVRMMGDFNNSAEWFEAMTKRQVSEDEVKQFIAKFLKIEVKDLDSSRIAKKLLSMWAAYAQEMGRNAYALYNTFTDFITHKKRLERAQADSFLWEEQRFSKLMDSNKLFTH